MIKSCTHTCIYSAHVHVLLVLNILCTCTGHVRMYCVLYVRDTNSLISSCTLQALLVRLTVLGVPRMPAPRRLVNPEEEEEEEPEADTDQFLQQLSSEIMQWYYLLYIHALHTCTYMKGTAFLLHVHVHVHTYM